MTNNESRKYTKRQKAVIAVILFIVFKDVCNGSCAIGKESEEWQTYQVAVPQWMPRFTPWYAEYNN